MGRTNPALKNVCCFFSTLPGKYQHQPNHGIYLRTLQAARSPRCRDANGRSQKFTKLLPRNHLIHLPCCCNTTWSVQAAYHSLIVESVRSFVQHRISLSHCKSLCHDHSTGSIVFGFSQGYTVRATSAHSVSIRYATLHCYATATSYGKSEQSQNKSAL